MCNVPGALLLFVQSAGLRVSFGRSKASLTCSAHDPVHLCGSHDRARLSGIGDQRLAAEWKAIACLGPPELRHHGPATPLPAHEPCTGASETGALRGHDGRAPGRSRTDTGDPFRGPASSLGLRGLGHDTPAGPVHSCSGEWGEKTSPGCTYSIHAAPRRTNAKRYQFTLTWKRLRTQRSRAVGASRTPRLCPAPLRRFRLPGGHGRIPRPAWPG
jgi:hypothetical protein